MIDLTKPELLQCLFNSFPARIVVKDLNGLSVYNNQWDRSKERIKNVTQNNVTPSDCKETDSCTSSCENSHCRTLQFPVKDSVGNILGYGSCELPRQGRRDDTELQLDTGNARDERAEKSPDQVVEHGSCESSRHDSGSDFQMTHKVQDESAAKDAKQANEGNFSHSAHNCDSNCNCCMHDWPLRNIRTAVAVCDVLKDKKDKPVGYIFRYVNPTFEDLLGVKLNDCIGKNLNEILPGEQVDWEKLFGTAGITGVSQECMHYSDTCGNWYSGRCYQMDAQLTRFALHFTAVTEQMAQEDRFSHLFDTMTQGVVYHNESGGIVAANPASERILGLTVDQMKGRSSVDPRWRTIHEDGSAFPGEEHPSTVALKTGKPVSNSTMGVFHPQDNKYHWIKVDAIPYFKPGSDMPNQVYTTFTDITEEKEWEKQLLRAKEKAVESDQLKSAFLANMSHEIRTPLNGVIGNVDLALSNGLSEKWREENLEGLKIAKTSGSLLLSIIQDILDLSKIEAGQLVVNDNESFSIMDVMNQTQNLANTIITSTNKNIAFSMTMDSNMKDGILGDPFRFQQVVNNLVSNAIKFTEQGRVELRAGLLDDETLEFSVLDTGKGIPPAHLESIFEPFRQVDISDTRQHGGTGLGLTITRKLVQMMGGELRVDSNTFGPNRGSNFAFTLPYRPFQSGPVTPRPTLHTKLPAVPDHTSKRNLGISKKARACHKILVAEDDPVSRKLVSRMLQRTGYQVLLACNGEEAVAAYKCMEGEVSLVLMDVQMPVLDGHDATRQIREFERQLEGRAQAVPIIALSAGAMKGDHEQGLSVGMTDYLTKPVDFKGLVETLGRYLPPEG